ncbi:MAG: hypothetical protein ABI854_05465, partial [Betaproteobacteria bacterium]
MPPPASAIPLDQAVICRRRMRAAAAPAAYDNAAALQHEVARRLLERLEYIRLSPGVVIDAGSGPGNSLQGLAAR